MTRRDDWPERLAAFLKACQSDAFSWGTLDCCLFAADAVREMTGADPAAWFRGRYGDEAGAIKALRDFSGGGVLEVMTQLSAEQAWPQIMPVYLQRGDVALLPAPEGFEAFGGALGICIGVQIAVMTQNGLAAVRLRDAIAGWHI